jgi:hypothetical protein
MNIDKILRSRFWSAAAKRSGDGAFRSMTRIVHHSKWCRAAPATQIPLSLAGIDDPGYNRKKTPAGRTSGRYFPKTNVMA